MHGQHPQAQLASVLLYLPCFSAVRGIHIVDGVVEVGGGRISSILRLFPRVMRFEAITLGHVVLGLNHTVLETHRLHEHIHVRQYERWGLLFFPLYLGSSLTQLWSGRDPHRHNCFEREAYKHSASAIVMRNTRDHSL
jgi:hypothetical protein